MTMKRILYIFKSGRNRILGLIAVLITLLVSVGIFSIFHKNNENAAETASAAGTFTLYGLKSGDLVTAETSGGSELCYNNNDSFNYAVATSSMMTLPCNTTASVGDSETLNIVVFRGDDDGAWGPTGVEIIFWCNNKVTWSAGSATVTAGSTFEEWIAVDSCTTSVSSGISKVCTGSTQSVDKTSLLSAVYGSSAASEMASYFTIDTANSVTSATAAGTYTVTLKPSNSSYIKFCQWYTSNGVKQYPAYGTSAGTTLKITWEISGTPVTMPTQASSAVATYDGSSHSMPSAYKNDTAWTVSGDTVLIPMREHIP